MHDLKRVKMDQDCYLQGSSLASTSTFNSTVMIPSEFHLPKSFLFQNCFFGLKYVKHLFRPEWCGKYSWQHYDVSTDTTFYYTCMKTEWERKYKVSTEHK